MDIDLVGIKTPIEVMTESKTPFSVFKRELKNWMDYYERDNASVMASGGRGWGKDSPGRSSVSQALLPSNLNDYGIPTSPSELDEDCKQIAAYLFGGEYKKAFAFWLDGHDEPLEFLDDHNDPRIIKISQLGQQKFTEEGIDYKQFGSSPSTLQ